MYVLCACKKGTKITDTHKNMAFMATRMWHLDSAQLTGSSWWFEYDGAGKMQLRTGFFKFCIRITYVKDVRREGKKCTKSPNK